MSGIILELAGRALAQPLEKTSGEGVAAALLLAHAAWNKTVAPAGDPRVVPYRKVLRALQDSNPNCLQELKTPDIEALIQELAELKLALHPADDRIILVCGLTKENKVHTEWRHPQSRGLN